MRDFDRMCLAEVEPLSADDIRAIREGAAVSQAVFAAQIGVSAALVSKWERGERQPGRLAAKRLAIVKNGGFGAVH